MKTLLKTPAFLKKPALGLLLVGAALLAPPRPLQATGPQPAGVRRTANFRYLVWASNPAGLRGSLQLVQADNGRVLYEEGSRSVSFGRCLNLGELPDGRYAFVVRLGTQHYRFPVQLRTTTLRTAELAGDTARVRLAAAL